MRKLLNIAFITLAFTVNLTVKANAVILSSQFVSEEIKKDVIEQVNQLVSGQVTVDVRSIPYKIIDVPSGNVVINAITSLNHFTSITLVKVIITVNGETAKTFGVPVKISVRDNVWVSKDCINKGESLNYSNLILEKKDISQIAESAARSNYSPVNSLAQKNFKSGEIIDTRFIETVPIVSKNSLVSLIFKTEGITVSMDGEALNDGKMGDFVKVRNKKFNKDYTGKVIDANTVLVNI